MKSLIGCLLLLFLSTVCICQPETDLITTSKYFSFHNNSWMNLHHFFYERASNRQRTHLQNDGEKFIELGDSLKIASLSAHDKIIFDQGVKFYKEKIIDQALLNSGRIFKWLQAQPHNNKIIDTTYSKEFTQMLNKLDPIYKKHFWAKHQAHNEKLVDDYIVLIRNLEDEIISKMENLSGYQWKDSVRIDITTYGNWAGAYSPSLNNIVISSIDPLMHSSLFIEFVFHESSHLLFLRNSPFRQALNTAAEKLSVDQPRNLWHAAMFYLSGMATKDALLAHDIDHGMIMERKGVFSTYFKDADFKRILNNYYDTTIDLNAMATELLQLK